MELVEMYEKYFPKIYNYIFYRVLNRHTAEDVTSTVFLKAAERWNTYDAEKGEVSGWLYRIASNALIDHFRSRRPAVDIDELKESPRLSVDFEGEAKLIKDENRRELYRALTTLDETTSDILAQKYFFDRTIRQIAKEKNMNESTVSTMHSRGLKKLRKSMSLV